MGKNERGKTTQMTMAMVQGEIMMAGGVQNAGGFKFYFARPSDGLDVGSGMREGDIEDDSQCIQVFTSFSLPSALIHLSTHPPLQRTILLALAFCKDGVRQKDSLSPLL